MRLQRIAAVLVTAVLASGWLAVRSTEAQTPKKRIAVMDFEYQTVHQFVYEMFGSDVDIGKGIATMLVTDLVKDGTYSLIERQQLDKILGEQNFQVSGRADVSTIVKLGKILGVDAVVIGAITQFGRDDKSLRVGAGAKVGPMRLGGFGKKSSKATVGLNARIVDVQTAEVLAVVEGTGESNRGGTSLYGAGLGGIGAGGAIDMGSSNFANTIIGEATKKAADALVAELVGANAKIIQKKVEISGLVADVAGSTITLNVGSGGGVRNGESYDVLRPGREIKDPATGRVIRRSTTPVGTVKITSVGADFAEGTLTGGPAKVGDCVGSCPIAGAAPPSSSPAAAAAEAAAPVPAQATAVVGVAIAALPSGAWTWTPYKFKGTEHFKYDVQQVEDGATKTGYYALDVQPAGSGRFRLKVDGKLGDDAYSSTITAPSAEGGMGMGGMGMGQLMALGPIGMMLFSPAAWMMFMGHEMTLGDGWSSSSGGTTNSVKVESQCQHASVNGLNTVVRENTEVKMQTCVSPNVALPLAVMTSDKKDKVELKLVEFRP